MLNPALCKLRNGVGGRAAVGNNPVDAGALGELLAHGVHAVEHDDDRIQSVDSLLGILGRRGQGSRGNQTPGSS